jgi:TRAP-type C4-dicarboxylate transport system permease large subunit
MTVFFLAGLYVAGALGSLALLLMEFFSPNPLSNIMSNRVWETYTRFLLVAIPLFILMGELVLRSGIADRMYRALDRWVAPIPGGLLHTNIVSCAIFAACSGSSISTAATISRVALPTFHTRGYNERLVVGSLAAGGTLGILIPPSVLLLIYGLSTGTSIGRLFLAGFIPGAIMALAFMAFIGFAAVVWPRVAPRTEGETFLSWRGWLERITGSIAVGPVIILVLAVLGSIYGGIATPSEAAAIGVYGAFLLAFLYNSQSLWLPVLAGFLRVTGLIRVYELVRIFLGTIVGLVVVHLAAQTVFLVFFPSQSLFVQQEIAEAIFLLEVLVLPLVGWVFILSEVSREELQNSKMPSMANVSAIMRSNLAMLREVFMSTMRTTCMIMFILLAAFTLQFAFAYLRISHALADLVVTLDLSQMELVGILIVFYLLLGTFMESYSMLATTLPILLETLFRSGIDLLWFGIIMIILLEAAQISPPQGLSLYVLHGARQETAEVRGVTEAETINDVYIGVLPFMGCMAVVIGILMVFPELVTWLPDQAKGAR